MPDVELLTEAAAKEVVKEFCRRMGMPLEPRVRAPADQDPEGLELRVSVGNDPIRRRTVTLEQGRDVSEVRGIGGRRAQVPQALWTLRRFEPERHRVIDGAFVELNWVGQPHEERFLAGKADVALRLALAEFVAMIVRYNAEFGKGWGNPVGAAPPAAD